MPSLGGIRICAVVLFLMPALVLAQAPPQAPTVPAETSEAARRAELNSAWQWGQAAATKGPDEVTLIDAFPQLVRAWKFDPKAPENLAYYAVPMQTKLEYGALYLGLTAYLAVMTFEVHGMIGSVSRST